MANVSDHRPDSLVTITELDIIGSLSSYRKVAIETLSDKVLLEIFDLCLGENEEINPWYAGARRALTECTVAIEGETLCLHRHVTWIWDLYAQEEYVKGRCRASGHRSYSHDFVGSTPEEDNIVVALKQHDRVCEIRLERFTRSQPEKLMSLV